MRVFAGLLIFLACLLIALGKMQIRRARRQAAREREGNAVGMRYVRQRVVGWFLAAVGLLLMIMGVVLW